MKFSAAKMIARLEKEGRANLIDDKTREIMNKLDGKEAEINRFKGLVYDQEEYIVYVDGKCYPVNKVDCE